MEIYTHIKALLDCLSKDIYEKEHILAMSLLSAIAGESIFLLGPPGTAKSLVARRLKLAFKDGNSFEYLMSRFSTPDEIFGPVSISLLKNEDRYERIVDGFLPTATIVFLDEIWKASPSIQNALLTAINERIFQNGRNTLQLPMKGLIAASNELPAEDEGLEALWDRFLVRMVSNCIRNEKAFYKMVRQKVSSTPQVPSRYLITDKLYQDWQKGIDAIEIPDEVCASITFIRKCLKEEMKKEEVNDMDYYISDRRWKKCFRLMQTSAFLNGRKAVDITDIPILLHCLWNKTETISPVIDMVCRSLTVFIDDKLDKVEKTINEALKPKAQPSTKEEVKKDTFSLTDNFYYALRNYPDGKCLFYTTDYDHLNTNRRTDGVIYRDEKKKAWIIHAILTGMPFSYKSKLTGNVKKIQLMKCNGGVIVDGTPYSFETSSSLFASMFNIPNVADEAMDTINKEILPLLLETQEQFSTATNLFLSEDDLKISKKYLKKCEKRINEMMLKVQNTQSLLDQPQ